MKTKKPPDPLTAQKRSYLSGGNLVATTRAAPTTIMDTPSIHNAIEGGKKNDAMQATTATSGASRRKYFFPIFLLRSKSYPTRELAIQVKTNTSVG